MDFIKATAAHTERIMELIEEAKAFLRASGVNQWQDGYPDHGDIEADIADGIGYVLIDDGIILAYTAIDFRGEEAYDTLKGQWLNDEPYVVIHRTAIDNTAKGKGLCQNIFQKVEDMARLRGVHNIRVDTDEDNIIMRHVIEKMGFSYCGTIWFANSVKIAFQKAQV